MVNKIKKEIVKKNYMYINDINILVLFFDSKDNDCHKFPI